MDLRELGLRQNQLDVVSRFLDLCQADPRILAAYLSGSYASGQADAYSDVDLFFVTTPEAYSAFLAEKQAFARKLGGLLFLEDFGAPHGYLFIHENGTEGEFWFGRPDNVQDVMSGPHVVLFDRGGIQTVDVAPALAVDPARQRDLLRRQLDWFWHELAHYIKAMGRREWWFAYGQVEAMRRICVILTRLDHDYSDAAIEENEPYFKIEAALPVERLKPMRITFCGVEPAELLQAGNALVQYYQALAPRLAESHELTYSLALERLLVPQMQKLSRAGYG